MTPEFPESQLLAAAFLFERENGRTLDSCEASELIATEMGHARPEEIARNICETLEGNPAPTAQYRQMAFWALGKRMDPELLGLLRHHLAVEIDRDMEVAYQIMISLDNLNEPVWPADQRGRSGIDYDVNRDAALRYTGLSSSQS